MITGKKIPYGNTPLEYIHTNILRNIDGQKVCVILPTIRNVRKLAENSYKTIDIYSIREFTEFASVSKGIHIPKQLRPFFLKKAALSLSNDDKLAVFKSENSIFFSNLLAFIEISGNIFSFYRELSAEMVNMEDLSKAGKYTDYETQIAVLQRLWENYIKIINEYGFYDEWENYRNPLLDNTFISRYDKFIFLIGGYLTKYEITQLQQLGINKDVALLFNFVGEPHNHHKIYEKSFNFEFDNNSNYLINNENTSICQCPNMISQLELITYFAFEYSKKNNILFENMAVIIPDEKIKSYFLRLDRYNLFDITSNEYIETFEFFSLLKLLSEFSTNIKFLDNVMVDISYIIKILSQPMLKRDLELDNLYNEYKFMLSNKSLYESINNLQEKPFFKDVLKYFFVKENNITLKDVCKNIYDFLENLNIYDHEKVALSKTLYKLQELEKIYSYIDDKIDFNEAFSIIINELSELRIQTPKGKITVTGILESRNLNFDVIFIPFMNEDIFPPKSKKDMFLNTEIRNVLSLPTYADRENLTKNYLLQIMANSKKSILLYEKNTNSRNKSRFIEEILINSNVKEEIYNPKEITLLKSDNFKFYTHKDEIIIEKNNEIMNALNSIEISSSFINFFINCPLKLYFSYIKKLKIKEKENKKIQPIDIGSTIHYTLEKIYKDNISPFDTLFEEKFKEIFYNKINSIHAYKYNVVERFKIDLVLNNIPKIKIEEINRRNNGFLPKYLEYRIDNVTFNKYKLKGFIDRIDYNNGIYEVIDYKYKSIKEASSEIDFEKVTDIQMPFYALLCELSLNTLPENLYYFDIKEKFKYINGFNMDNYDNFKEFLINTLDNLFNVDIPFTQTTKKATCTYCDYKDICGR